MTSYDAAALQADLEREWEESAAFAPFQRQLPIPDDFKRAFWKWYEAHRDDVILRKRLLVFAVTVQVRHLRTVFVAIFGPQPG